MSLQNVRIAIVPLIVFWLGVFVARKEITRYKNEIFPPKYSSANMLVRTSTASYSSEKIRDSHSAAELEDCQPNCSYMQHTTNEEFMKTRGLYYNFSTNDSEDIQFTEEKLACLPKNFGYSIEKGNEVFPPFQYPSCASQLDGLSIAEISLSHSNNSLSIKCPTGQPIYILQPNESLHKLHMKEELETLWNPKEYSKEVKINSEEFAYAKCGDDNYNSAVYIPKKDEAAYNRARKIISERSQGTFRPQYILLLTIDSFSRKHFFRKLPETVKFLKSLSSSDFPVFDFKIHNILGAKSVDNMIPVLGNFTELVTIDDYQGDILKEGALWSIFKNSGYVTLIGLENCDYYFLTNIGRIPSVDHIIRDFYCAALEYLNLSTNKGAKHVQRCIGRHMSHYYSLNYTYSFSKLYRDVNQLMYLHLNTAHEGSGQHASTLDSDLAVFLKQYIYELSVTGDIAIFLQGDHGMRYGNWFKTLEGYQENKLPAFFFITSKNITDKVEFSYDTLTHNTKRLTAKADLRPTALSLLDLPYYKHFNRKNDPYSQNYIDLLTQKINNNRTCGGAGVGAINCSCMQMTEIVLETAGPRLSSMLTQVTHEIISQMNQVSQAPLSSTQSVCQSLTLGKIINVWGITVSNVLEAIQLKFSVQESPSAEFEAIAYIGSIYKSSTIMNRQDGVLPAPLVYNNARARTRTLSLTRKDPYSGLCETLSRDLKVPAEICVCKDFDSLLANYPSLLSVNSRALIKAQQ